MVTIELPTTQARKLISSANLSWIDNLYNASSNLNLENQTNETNIVVSEVVSEPTGFTNDNFKRWNFVVEVQIYFELNNEDLDVMNCELQLASLFTDNGWTVSRSMANINDPDTGQVTKTFYFNKIGGIE
ncbi:DUF806 family protein [Fructilactobacillus sp. Tb1]|uniref:DUF806 family protein n=1 Tax=Fructilactobacillus sp. Tb1 TaxID=3422304 RepID=UPI003D29C1D4